MIVPKSIRNLIEALERLPGIGPKTAARLTFYLLHVPEREIETLAEAVGRLKKDTVICQTCFNVAEKDPCEICSSPQRERTVLAVVESPLDVLALEKAGFRGLYHVLQGVIDPLNNIGPEELRIKELLRRVQNNSENGSEQLRKLSESDGQKSQKIRNSEALTHRGTDAPSYSDLPSYSEFSEIILATNPSVEGEATAMYIQRNLKSPPDSLRDSKRAGQISNVKSPIKITRLARGLPVGGDLEYADDVTLGKALEGRTEY